MEVTMQNARNLKHFRLMGLACACLWSAVDLAAQDVAQSSVEFAEFSPIETDSGSDPDSIIPAQFTRPVNPTTDSDQEPGSVRIRRLGNPRINRLPGTSFLSDSEAKKLPSSDLGGLLGKSPSKLGIGIQSRNPIVNDVRTRGNRVGQLLASGSYWAPARMDLDTLLNKVDPRLIDGTTIIKGPYSAMYGPGFNFVDFRLAQSPRAEYGRDSGGSTSIEYQTNGQGWYGRQTAWMATESFGVQVSYGHKTRNDYTVGSGGQLVLPADSIAEFRSQGVADDLLLPTSTLPSSFNSRDFSLAIGFDPTTDSHLEFNYVRLDQTNVEFPGMVFDINYLVTDGFEMEYLLEDQELFDELRIEGWHNQTRFRGDTSRGGKNRQIPGLSVSLGAGNGNPADSFAITDVDAYSAGYRTAVTWGYQDSPRFTLGTDLIYLGQQLNDIEPNRPGRTNFPIPRSHSADIGLFAELHLAINERLRITSGARADSISTDARNHVSGLVEDDGVTPRTLTSEFNVDSLDRFFQLWSAFVTAEYEMNQRWTANFGAGSARRALTLTELYADQSFIALLQPGMPFLFGDPDLRAPRLRQIDLGLTADYAPLRLHVGGFHGWVRDYVTFDSVEDNPETFAPGQEQHRLAFTNTDLATLVGFEFSSTYDVHRNVTAFGTVSYVEGTDRARNAPSRIGSDIRPNRGRPSDTPRSEVAGVNSEPLPGISPLESIVGLRVHEAADQPEWSVELTARIVDNQDRVAASLFERATPGFTIWNLRTFWRATDSLLLTAGVENITDKFYREHLDSRAGRGVYRPGTNFYFSSELSY